MCTGKDNGVHEWNRDSGKLNQATPGSQQQVQMSRWLQPPGAPSQLGSPRTPRYLSHMCSQGGHMKITSPLECERTQERGEPAAVLSIHLHWSLKADKGHSEGGRLRVWTAHIFPIFRAYLLIVESFSFCLLIISLFIV